MELYPLKVFLTVATEKSFSRAGEKLLRTQPAISLAIQRLESELQEKLIDRSGKELLLAAQHRRERIHGFIPVETHREVQAPLSKGQSPGPKELLEQDPEPVNR